MILLKDYYFKEVFTGNDATSKLALCSLLSAYLQKTVRDAIVITNEVKIPLTRQKESRYDIHVVFNDGEKAVIEVQLNVTKDDLQKRILYYLNLIAAAQPMKGKDYREMKNIYVLFITTQHLFEDDQVYHRFMYYDKENQTTFSDVQQIITVEIGKEKGKLDKEEFTEMKGWNFFLKNYEKDKESDIMEYIKRKVEGIRMAEEKIKGISEEEIEYLRKTFAQVYAWEDERYIEREKEEARKEARTIGRAEGLAEGRAEGLAEGRAEGLAKGLAEGRTEGRLEGKTEGIAEAKAEAKAEKRQWIQAMAESMSISEIARVLKMEEREIIKIIEE